MTSPSQPDTGGTIDGAPARDDVLVAAPDPVAVFGGVADPSPNRIPHKRKKSSQVTDDGTPPPAVSAKKADWVDYASGHRGCDKATAEAMTKDELVQVYGDGPKASSVSHDNDDGLDASDAGE